MANARRILYPGLFVRLRLPVGNPRPALLVPEEAVGSDQGLKFLFVVNDQDEVEYRRVKIGILDEGLRVIESGVARNDRVVVSGLQRIRAGDKVRAVLADRARSAAATAAAGQGSPAAPANPAAPDAPRAAAASGSPAPASRGGTQVSTGR
jgi:hypothetical protein